MSSGHSHHDHDHDHAGHGQSAHKHDTNDPHQDHDHAHVRHANLMDRATLDVSKDTALTGRNERRTWFVFGITLVTMVAEIVWGSMTHSMSLTADGWHMASHSWVLALSAIAYWFARTRAKDAAFAFGTGKIYALAGYTGSVALFIVAGSMIAESIEHWLERTEVAFAEALPVACIGLVVNLASVFLLRNTHKHSHGPSDDHAHDHEDHNLRAVYLHVLSDLLTSGLALVALLLGTVWGIRFLDPLSGIIGGIVVLYWAFGLARVSAKQLLDMRVDEATERELCDRVTRAGVEVASLTAWTVSPGAIGCVVHAKSATPDNAARARAALAEDKRIVFAEIGT